MFHVFKLQSTKIGFNPSFTTQRAVDIIENDGIITSLPLFKFNDFIAISRAAVPLETAMPYNLLLYFENASRFILGLCVVLATQAFGPTASRSCFQVSWDFLFRLHDLSFQNEALETFPIL